MSHQRHLVPLIFLYREIIMVTSVPTKTPTPMPTITPTPFPDSIVNHPLNSVLGSSATAQVVFQFAVVGGILILFLAVIFIIGYRRSKKKDV